MKFVFSFILVMHASIHLMGFAKAFQLAEIQELTKSISKPIGILWLVVALMFVFSAVLFLTKKNWWFVIAFISVIISQILIIIFWKDAKFGTIANSIVLLVSIAAFGNYQFNNMVQKESEQLLQNIHVENLPIISKNDITQLPEIAQKWMEISGVLGKEKVVSVRLKQIGEMRTKPNSKWMHFTANQYFNLKNPGFIWITKVDAMPIIKMVGRDKFENGKGAMLIKLASLIPVVNESENIKINQGAMVRYLAEICWFPSAALNKYITWEAIDKNTAKATFTIANNSVSGVFLFSNDGNLISFEAARYYGGKNDSKLKKWCVIINDYKTFNGIKIPNKNSVIWKLKEGNFTWLNLEITQIAYNTKYH